MHAAQVLYGHMHCTPQQSQLIPPPEYVGPSKVVVLDDFNSILAKGNVDVSVFGLLCLN